MAFGSTETEVLSDQAFKRAYGKEEDMPFTDHHPAAASTVAALPYLWQRIVAFFKR